MVTRLLNADQERRLATHLGLLLADLDALIRLPELMREGPDYERVRSSLRTTRAAVEHVREDLALPVDTRPALKRRVGAVAEVWAARVEDLRSRRLMAYGDVHPDLTRVLDLHVARVRRALEVLAGAVTTLPDD